VRVVNTETFYKTLKSLLISTARLSASLKENSNTL